jgi:uncharacterized membrane protein
MFSTIIEFVDVLLAALLAGSMFCVWLIFNPEGLSASAYITLQQQAIRTLNQSMPALGAVTILVTSTAAVLARSDRGKLMLLIAAVFCFVVAGLMTRFLNQPINSIVKTWNSDAPPANWTSLRDAWWRWHILRSLAGIGGLGLVIAAVLKRGLAA